MFQALRQGSPFYILEKGDEIKLKVGKVCSITSPQPKYNNYPPYTQENTVDIKVEVDGSTMEFNKVPGNLSIANFGAAGMVISESREAMLAEIEGIQQSSRQALANVAYHERAVKSCDNIARQLNPMYAKEQERDEALGALQSEVAGIKDSLAKILEALPKPATR